MIAHLRDVVLPQPWLGANPWLVVDAGEQVQAAEADADALGKEAAARRAEQERAWRAVDYPHWWQNAAQRWDW